MHNSLDKAAPEPKPMKEKLMRSQTVRSIPLVPVCAPSPRKEKQQKYLGLVIEKDEEYLIERRSTSELDTEEYVYEKPASDPVKRVYKPIREKYIAIVKHSRKLYL
jgi:hypothetical protein